MPWIPPANAKKVDKHSIEGEFWKPSAKGDVLIGRVHALLPPPPGGRIKSGAAVVAPCLIVPRDGVTHGYGSMRVGINSWLAKLIDHTHVGKGVAIGYKGMKATPTGNMRVYAVYVLSDDDLRKQFVEADAESLFLAPPPRAATAMAAGPGMPGAELPGELYDEEEDDELPF